MCSGAFWNWWVGAAARFNVVAQGPSETPWPEVGTLGWPGRLRSLPLAGVVVGCGLAWVFRGVGMFHQGPVSELLWSRGLWAAWTRAGPSSQKGLLLLAQHLCGESQPPTVPSLLHALRMPLEDPSLYPFGVSAPSRVPSALVKRCSHTVPGHRAFRRTSGQVAQCEWVAATSAPLGALSRCWGAGDQCLKIQMSGGRGQGSQATSSVLPFLAGGPLWPACRLEAWFYLLPRPCSAGFLPLPQSGGTSRPPSASL